MIRLADLQVIETALGVLPNLNIKERVAPTRAEAKLSSQLSARQCSANIDFM